MTRAPAAMPGRSGACPDVRHSRISTGRPRHRACRYRSHRVLRIRRNRRANGPERDARADRWAACRSVRHSGSSGPSSCAQTSQTTPVIVCMYDELYAEVVYGKFDLRIGRQVISWGKTDLVNPTDHLSPRDFTDPLESEEERLGVIAVRPRVQWGRTPVGGRDRPRIHRAASCRAGSSRWSPPLPRVPNPPIRDRDASHLRAHAAARTGNDLGEHAIRHAVLRQRARLGRLGELFRRVG